MAITLAVWLLPIVPAVAVNTAVVEPEAMTTDAGTVNRGLLLESVTVIPPAGAAADRVIVQEEAPALATFA